MTTSAGGSYVALLIVGVVQAAFGIVVYLQRYHVHG
jgi:hypothetical protein